MHQCLKFPFFFCEYIEIWVCSWCHFDASYRLKETKGGKRGKEGLQLIPSLYTNLYFSSCLNMEVPLYTAYFLTIFTKKRQRHIFIMEKDPLWFPGPIMFKMTLGQHVLERSKDFGVGNYLPCCNFGFGGMGCQVPSLTPVIQTHTCLVLLDDQERLATLNSL